MHIGKLLPQSHTESSQEAVPPPVLPYNQAGKLFQKTPKVEDNPLKLQKIRSTEAQISKITQPKYQSISVPPLPPRARVQRTLLRGIAPIPSKAFNTSSEYITMKEMLANLVDLLAGNAPVISQLNTHLFSSDLIPKAVHVTVETTGLTPYDRSNKLFSSVLAILECHSNPNSVFSSLITALQKVGLNNMASKLMDNLSKIQYYNNYFLFIYF